MNQDWQDFLAQQGARIQGGAVEDFGDAQAELQAARDGTVLCDLGQFGTLKAAGEEAQGFLQNLLSSDIKLLSPTQAQFSSFNSPKGRMMASFVLWQSAGDYFLQVHGSLAAAMQKRLSMFVLRSKVKVTDASAEVVSLGLAGRGAAELIKAQFGSVPEADWAVLQNEHASVIRLGAARYQINTSAQHAPALWAALAQGARPAGSACWEWLNVQAGLPVITPPTQEQFVLQMANLDALGGVSFKKGCYPGQEVVARTQHIGKIKRRMFLAHVDVAARAGDEVFSAEMAGQPSGMVINAAAAPDGGYDMLVVMQISSRETQSVHLQSLEGAKLNFLELPYTLP
ncbi:MAG TPA: folate-binding protein [Gallionellaceae bacterium]|nr:folate-binding protein [Gallionellaceae bacterium]